MWGAGAVSSEQTVSSHAMRVAVLTMAARTTNVFNRHDRRGDLAMGVLPSLEYSRNGENGGGSTERWPTGIRPRADGHRGRIERAADDQPSLLGEPPRRNRVHRAKPSAAAGRDHGIPVELGRVRLWRVEVGPVAAEHNRLRVGGGSRRNQLGGKLQEPAPRRHLRADPIDPRRPAQTQQRAVERWTRVPASGKHGRWWQGCAALHGVRQYAPNVHKAICHAATARVLGAPCAFSKT